MCSDPVIILLAFVVQAHATILATNDTASLKNPMDKSVDAVDQLADKLVDQTLEAWPLQHTDLDDIELHEPGNLFPSRDAPAPPVWPPKFHAMCIQNRSGALSTVDLYYDWPGGRNLLLIQPQLGDILWDFEFTNGSSYYFHPASGDCNVLQMGVGILRPDWLANATYLGAATVDGGFECDVFTKANFITYWAEKKTGRPVRWVFHADNMTIDVIRYSPDEMLPDAQWQLPGYCLKNETDGKPAPLFAQNSLMASASLLRR